MGGKVSKAKGIWKKIYIKIQTGKVKHRPRIECGSQPLGTFLWTLNKGESGDRNTNSLCLYFFHYKSISIVEKAQRIDK
jgi:hypothetical protein